MQVWYVDNTRVYLVEVAATQKLKWKTKYQLKELSYKLRCFYHKYSKWQHCAVEAEVSLEWQEKSI